MCRTSVPYRKYPCDVECGPYSEEKQFLCPIRQSTEIIADQCFFTESQKSWNAKKVPDAKTRNINKSLNIQEHQCTYFQVTKIIEFIWKDKEDIWLREHLGDPPIHTFTKEMTRSMVERAVSIWCSPLSSIDVDYYNGFLDVLLISPVLSLVVVRVEWLT